MSGAARPVGMSRILLSLVIALAAILAVYSCASTMRTDTPRDMHTLHQMQATHGCEDQVRDRLRSPSTAEFDTGARLVGATWYVSGTVDAENGFGAMVRAGWSCSATVSGDMVTARLIELDSR